MVSAGVKLKPGYGGTKFGSPTYAIPRPGDEVDWAYMEFSNRAKVRWMPQGDGTFECQSLTTNMHSLPIENLPDVRGYTTSDLWEPHPTKDHLWKIVGRIDDVVIHSSGEKTVPAPMENIVMSSPYVMGAIIFGRTHDQPGILIEPKAQYAIDITDQTQVAELRNHLWSVIEEANRIAPAFSRIFKEMILFTSKDKPLPRAGKGTVMRKMALKTYDDEIEGLYATVEQNAKGEDVVPPITWENKYVRVWLLYQAADIHSGKTFDISQDLFEQGFDSLSATILHCRIAGALRASKDNSTIKAAENITQNTVYRYPSIETLATFLVQLVADPEGFQDGKNAKAEIEAMIEKYSAGLDSSHSDFSALSAPKNKVILLTGSTGNLGSQILADLLLDPSVERVYALNRASTGSILERHTERFQDKGLDIKLLQSDRLAFVEGDAALSRFGLSDQLYNEISDSVTDIIHTAWHLDFNLSLSSFEPNVRGTRKLIDFARSGPHPESIRFLFTSSVASAQSWGQPEVLFPEEVLTDALLLSEMAMLLAKSGIQVSSLRIGQISGGLPNGAWATSDWLPILVKSSLALGALPNATGLISWLPMHTVSKAILDVAFSSEKFPVAINLVHPRPLQWSEVIDALKVALVEDGFPLRVVPFQEWFSSLEKRSKNASDADIQAIPAVKLLEFFRAISKADYAIAEAGRHEVESGGLAKFATAKAQHLSQTMREVRPIGAENVLKVDENTTLDQIKKAYRQRCLEHHPDKNINDPDAARRFARVQEAYERRSIYDENRAQKEFAPRSSPPTQDAPRSSTPKDDAISQMGLLEFLFALLTGLLCLVFNWLWKPWYKSFRKRYDFQTYVEKAHANANVLDPGISLQDILDFETSIDDWKWDPQFARVLRNVGEAEKFYAYWSHFETLKSFEWIQVRAEPGEVSNANRIKRRNKVAQEEARKRYNQAIRMLVRGLFEHDPRRMIHLARVAEKARWLASQTAEKSRSAGNRPTAHPSRRGRRKKKAKA
ncbi:hypothetical protein C0989_009601 [Termitomyces sp. Mn162]|nr:hypothetical protein C0989_009601 [Termitomyces sp. Mn162]